MKELLNRYLKKPKAAEEAAQAQPGQKLWLEVLIFIGVFMVSSMAMSPFIMIGMVVLLIFNPNSMEILKAGNSEAWLELVNQVSGSEGSMVLTLFADIMMILIVILFAKLIQKRKVHTIGFTKKGFVKEYLAGMAAGFVLFSAAILLCVITGALKINGLSAQIPIFLLILYFLGYIVQGMAEEVLCRGYFMISVARRYSIITAILANALVFAALHLLNDGITVLAFINLTFFGIFASVYFIKRGNIWGVAALHSVWNFVQGNFYGIQVSGMPLSSSVLSSEIAESAGWINGGSFGLEGGIAVTVCLLIGTGILLLCPQKNAA